MHARALAATAVVLGAFLPVAAWGQDLPTAPKPAIEGTPREGETLTAVATGTGVPGASADWAWLRCESSSSPCDPIDGATSQTYLVATADVGSVLRVRLTVGSSPPQESEPTDVVTAAPPPPPPAPDPPPPPPDPTPPPSDPTPPPPPPPPPSDPPADPTPTPAPTPTPTTTPAPPPSPTFDLPPTPVNVPATVEDDGKASVTPMLDPFPVVRIRGLLTATGARVTLFTVRASRGVLIVVRCRGSSCPVRRLARRARSTRARPFERYLRAGTRLQVKVTKPGYVGKWTTIVIRRGAPPKRSDRCVYPDGRGPVRCPTY